MKFTRLLLAVLLSVSANLALADPSVFIRDPDADSIVSVDGFMIVADVYGISPGDQIESMHVEVLDMCGGDSARVEINCGSMTHMGILPLRVLGNWQQRMCNPIQRPPKMVIVAEQGGSLMTQCEYRISVFLQFETKIVADSVIVMAE